MLTVLNILRMIIASTLTKDDCVDHKQSTAEPLDKISLLPPNRSSGIAITCKATLNREVFPRQKTTETSVD